MFRELINTCFDHTCIISSLQTFLIKRFIYNVIPIYRKRFFALGNTCFLDIHVVSKTFKFLGQKRESTKNGYMFSLFRVWREVARKDCQAYNLNRKDATVRSRRRKLIKDD